MHVHYTYIHIFIYMHLLFYTLILAFPYADSQHTWFASPARPLTGSEGPRLQCQECWDDYKVIGSPKVVSELRHIQVPGMTQLGLGSLVTVANHGYKRFMSFLDHFLTLNGLKDLLSMANYPNT